MNLELIPTIELWKLRDKYPEKEALRGEERKRLKFFAELKKGIPESEQDEQGLELALDIRSVYCPDSLTLRQEERDEIETANEAAAESEAEAEEYESALKDIESAETVEEAKKIAAEALA